MRVVHVTECLAGGVQTALTGYIKATPELDHVVLANSRRGHNVTLGGVDGASVFVDLPTNHAAAVRKVAAIVDELKPDVIHAHSSFAGAYSRIATIFSQTPVVYTPHALAYGRPDFSNYKRNIFRAAEKLLARNTAVFAGCSVHESQLLKELGASAPVVTIPNALPPDHPAQSLEWNPAHAAKKPVVGMVGRINEYRDPELFIDIARAVRNRLDVDFIWLGDGDDEQREMLNSAGIEVSGWLDRSELQQKLTELSMLVYTSKWDGFPMVILESISSKVPTFVSDIAPLRECPADARFSTADEAAEMVFQQLQRGGPLSESWDVLRAEHSFEKQKQALLDAYDLAINNS